MNDLTDKELRARARAALHGKWGVAVAVCFVASLFSGGSGTAGSGSGSEEGLMRLLDSRTAAVLMTIAVVMLLVSVVLSGAVSLGLHGFLTKLIKGEEVRFSNLFDYFHQLGRGFCMNFLVGLFVFLWSLLFIVPGVIAAYSYAMVPFLMAEFPDLGVMEAIAESKRLMLGNKIRFFLMELSFFGWQLLCLFTLGIGYLWLTPYMYATQAAFYMDVTGRSNPESETEEPETPAIPQAPSADPWDRPQNPEF